MVVAPWRGLRAWLAEIDRQLALMRPSSASYGRFDTTARLLTVERLRSSSDADALLEVAERLSWARRRMGFQVHDLDRVWSRTELGVLLLEARNRSRLLALGRSAPKAKGPQLDPPRLPDTRLDLLIQRHRDMAVVEALRAERARRGRLRQEEGGEGEPGRA